MRASADPAINLEASPGFEVHEKTIAYLRAARVRSEVEARGVVTAYLERIVGYAQPGPALNALVN